MKIFITTILIILYLPSLSQVPWYSSNDNYFDEGYSDFALMDSDKVFIEFANQHQNSSSGIYESFIRELVLDSKGNIISQRKVDSSDANGFGVFNGATIERNGFLYHFSSIVDYSNTQKRALFRKTTKNLQNISDTIINFNNNYIGFSDVISYSSGFLLSGYLIETNTSYAFILKVDTNFNILDSTLFQLYCSYRHEMGLLKDSNIIILHLSSEIFANDLILRYSLDSLNFIDTLYKEGFSGSWYYPNSFDVKYNDSLYISPVALLNGDIDTDFFSIGWFVRNINFKLSDTIAPFWSKEISDRVGIKKCLQVFHDTLLLAYSHNNNYIGSPPSDSTSIGILLADINGNVYKEIYFGSGYNYHIENIHRFENGNILVMANKMNFTNNSSLDFDIWLIDKIGNVIQQLMIPRFKQKAVIIFPNPATTTLNLRLQAPNQSIASLTVYNTLGQQVMALEPKKSEMEVDVRSLQSGVYLVEGFTNKGERFSGKFVKE